MYGAWLRGAGACGIFTDQINTRPSIPNHPSYQVSSASRISTKSSFLKYFRSCKRSQCLYGAWLPGAEAWGIFTDQINTRPFLPITPATRCLQLPEYQPKAHFPSVSEVARGADDCTLPDSGVLAHGAFSQTRIIRGPQLPIAPATRCLQLSECQPKDHFTSVSEVARRTDACTVPG